MVSDPPGYRIIRQVGTGAASKIYFASDLKRGRTVAIKHVIRQSADDDKFIDQVDTEYQVSSTIDHPYIRKSYEIFRVRKLLALKEVMLVMEYVDGLTVEKARPNRLNTFLTLFRRVADGLHAMHQAGYVHSDIKPTNIMVGQGGVVKIIDFGQSCKTHRRKERIQGTPDYIAPEQVQRLPLDARTDVYNLGATMYWVLTSEKYPTALRGIDEQVGKNVLASNKPVAPIEHNDKIPRSLSNLIMDCCRDHPDERPADMMEVVARLEVARKLWKKYRESLRASRESTDAPAADEAAKASGEDEA